MVLLHVLRFTTLTTIFATSLASLSESINSTCNEIATSISSASDVYYPDSLQYFFDNFHFSNSSRQESVCSVEPGTPEDVGIILQILRDTRTAFGVKGGGHTFNANFSSTAGVQIALSRFNQVNVNKTSQTVEIGTGLIWDEVYGTLEPQNLTVVGGRVTGVGVAGLVLGGGLSYKTNEYGIAAANVVEFELVLPNGTVTTVNAESNPDLFFAVRGTQNNFGVVTSITMKLLPQGLIWGGVIVYPLNATTIPSITAALVDFQDNVKDPKAAVNFVVGHLDGELTFDAVFFYNEPERPSGIFDKFLAIPSLVSNVSTIPYSALTLVLDGNSTLGYRTADDHLMVEKWTPNLFTAIVNETVFWSKEAQKVDPKADLPYIMEFFLPSMLQHGDPGAWPPQGSSSPALMPLAAQWSWTSSPDTDNWFMNAQRASISNLLRVVASEGLSTSLPRYINYALTGTPVVDIWGEENIARLQKIQTVYDPDDVMGLTGGFKVPKASASV